MLRDPSNGDDASRERFSIISIVVLRHDCASLIVTFLLSSVRIQVALCSRRGYETSVVKRVDRKSNSIYVSYEEGKNCLVHVFKTFTRCKSENDSVSKNNYVDCSNWLLH